MERVEERRQQQDQRAALAIGRDGFQHPKDRQSGFHGLDERRSWHLE